MVLSFLQQGLRALAGLFYPALCAACGRDLQGDEDTLCLSCVSALPRTGSRLCADNAAFRIFTGRVPIEQAASFVYFTKQGLMQHLLHQLKYSGRADIGVYLGKLFAAEFKISASKGNIDAVIPVPLHYKKEFRRGYNQSAAFARGISEMSGLPLLTGVLKRTRNTGTQTNRTRAERIRNVSGVFRLVKPLDGKHVLLVDDVLTTGATLEACALELLKCTGLRVSVATIALAID